MGEITFPNTPAKPSLVHTSLSLSSFGLEYTIMMEGRARQEEKERGEQPGYTRLYTRTHLMYICWWATGAIDRVCIHVYFSELAGRSMC